MHTRILRQKWGSASRALIIVVLCCAPALAQEVQIYVSSQAGDRLAAKPAAHSATGAAEPAALTFAINPEVTYQTIAGFGASFMEAGLMVINTLPQQQQEAVLRAMFDAKEGAGFSAMKTPIAGTDFMSAGPFYTYDPVAGDVEMKHFSIARDLGPNGVITYIKRARRYGILCWRRPWTTRRTGCCLTRTPTRM